MKKNELKQLIREEIFKLVNEDISESQKTLLFEAIMWEKELSWSDGYATAEEQITEAK